MSSSDRDDHLNLGRDLPATAEDVAALRRNRPGPMSYAEYIEFLKRLPTPTNEELRARPLLKGEPFELP
jgi:hypothetical protein